MIFYCLFGRCYLTLSEMWFCAKMTQITSCIEKIITLINMNTDKIFARGGQPYEAPSVTPLDILSEGLLCQSFGDNFDENNHTEKFNPFDFEEL